MAKKRHQENGQKKGPDGLSQSVASSYSREYERGTGLSFQ
jgi:hypothetical protein